MNWKKEYDNDDRGGNWWDVTDGESSFRCMTEAEADFLLSKLQPAPVQQEPLGFMNAGNILEMQQKSLPYAYIYPVKSTGVSVAVYTSPQPAQQEPVAHTTGHCENHKQKGGCQLHNLQCGWPDCDRKPITTPPAQQEPVAWPCLIAEADFSEDTVTLAMQCTDYKVSAGKHWLSNTPPAQRKPLTNEEITKAFNEAMTKRPKDASNAETNRLFVRAIEAAHGIKENT